MSKRKGFGASFQAVFLVSLSLGIGFADLRSSYADGCGTYCKARQARGICHQIVKSKGLNGHQRDVEFEKCRADVMNSKQAEELVDDAEAGVGEN